MKVACEPPKTTGIFLRERIRAIEYALVTVEVVVEMPTRSDR
jgi:hypothetical protein